MTESESNVLTLVERLRKHVDDQIDEELEYIKTADALMSEAARRIVELEAVLRLIDDGGLHSPKWLQERIRPVMQPPANT
jgi:hypothetical protein